MSIIDPNCYYLTPEWPTCFAAHFLKNEEDQQKTAPFAKKLPIGNSSFIRQ